MKLIIDINDNDYKALLDENFYNPRNLTKGEMLIVKGTPLNECEPKGYIIREDAFMALTGDITDCTIEEFIKRVREKLSKLPSAYPKNIMIIDKDKLECDSDYNAYYDAYTAYSSIALEAAQIEL